jgi:hypothetical protein
MLEAAVPKPHSPAARLFFFWSGVTATILYRAIIILEHIEGPWVKMAWYVGTIGFILYFAHRYQVTEIRARVIAEQNLIAKIERSNLSEDDRASLRYVLGTLRSSKEKWNYITIFVTSVLTLITGAILDLQ